MKLKQRNNILCICMAVLLLLSLIISPMTSVYATEITDKTAAEETTPQIVETTPSETIDASEPADENEQDVAPETTNPATEIDEEGQDPSDTTPAEDVQETTEPTENTEPDVPETEPVEPEEVPTEPEDTTPAEPEIVIESVDYELVITTQIASSEIFYINGAPTFIYRIEQLDDDGQVVKYWYKSVTIEKEYTELMMKENGDVSVDVLITLPSGNYRILSEGNGRYAVNEKEQIIELPFIETVIVPEETDEEENEDIIETPETEDIELERKTLIFSYRKSGSRNRPSSSCVAASDVAEYVGISLKANKTTFDANTVIEDGDFTLLLVKADGTTEAVDMDGMLLDFSTNSNVYPEMKKYPNVSGDVKVSVSYAFGGVAYYADTTVNLYQRPYILYLETELKAGKENNGNADHYFVTAVYSDGSRQVLLPEEKKVGSIRINSWDIDGSYSYNFHSASHLSIDFADGACTSGVGETVEINGSVLYGELVDMSIAGDTINIKWDGSSRWTMTVTPVYVENNEKDGAPTYRMKYEGGNWKAVLS